MKLRIRGNSIRLRLNKSEVEKFAESGQVRDEISFGFSTATDKLTYSVETSLSKEVSVRFMNNRITVFVPQGIAENWIETGEIGIEAEQRTGGNSTLRILVEKDFVCLNPRENEDESDNYAHPNEGKNC